MVAITSISPNHKNFDRQKAAVKSWIEAGYRVVSLNAPEEIKELTGFEGVEFIPTYRHNKLIFGRPHVIASAFIDYLKEQNEEYNLILNSDIIINGDTEKVKALSKSGVVIMNRRDFHVDINEVNPAIFEGGFDGFFINQKYLSLFPQTLLCMGQCFWDYWVPMVAINAGVKLYRPTDPYLFHQKHNVQYSTAQWEKTGEMFRQEMGLTSFGNVGKMSDYTFKKIKLCIQ